MVGQIRGRGGREIYRAMVAQPRCRVGRVNDGATAAENPGGGGRGNDGATAAENPGGGGRGNDGAMAAQNPGRRRRGNAVQNPGRGGAMIVGGVEVEEMANMYLGRGGAGMSVEGEDDIQELLPPNEVLGGYIFMCDEDTLPRISELMVLGIYASETLSSS